MPQCLSLTTTNEKNYTTCIKLHCRYCISMANCSMDNTYNSLYKKKKETIVFGYYYEPGTTKGLLYSIKETTCSRQHSNRNIQKTERINIAAISPLINGSTNLKSLISTILTFFSFSEPFKPIIQILLKTGLHLSVVQG